MTKNITAQSKIALFEKKEVRKTIHNNEWWFVIEDVVLVLVESKDVKQYIQKLKQRDEYLKKGWVQIVHTLLIETKGGNQKMSCANTEGLFRIIQSIPSLKSEPFKLWLAKVGYERIQEIEDPELASKRARALYKAKGRPTDWIEKRMRGIAIREELTDEWKDRNAKDSDYSILTNEISQATFGMTVSQYKKHKELKRQNLRDHMTDLELIFSMLGERATTEITRSKDSTGFSQLKNDAQAGGVIAGDARKKLEQKTKKTIISRKNFLLKNEVEKFNDPK